MKNIAIVFSCIFIYRLVSNASALIRINHYSEKYEAYLRQSDKGFDEYTTAVVQLFKLAGMTDRQVPFVQPMGYGQLLQGHTSLFSNMSNRREDVVANMLMCFSEAKGTFKHRIFENLSPIFWINQLLFLPQAILAYLGVKPESVIVKLLQLLYWIVTPFFLAFRDVIYQYITSLLG